MQTLKYYTQENGLYIFKIQKAAYGIFGILIILSGIWATISLFDKFTEKPLSLLAPILLFAIGGLIFLRTTAIIFIDPKRAYLSWQPFYFKKPRLFHFKDFDGFSTLHLTSLGIKGTSTVGIVFIENGKEKTVNLRQTFMSTKSLQGVVDETEAILGLNKEK